MASVGRTPPRRPLHGRIVLVIGADDVATRGAALHLSARGAALVACGRDRDAVLITAGLAAASGGTVRVVDEATSPLLDPGVIDAATRALGRPTDALVSGPLVDESPALVDRLRALVGSAGSLGVVPVRPPGGARAFAEAMCAAFEAAAVASPRVSTDASDTLGRS